MISFKHPYNFLANEVQDHFQRRELVNYSRAWMGHFRPARTAFY